MMKPQRSMNHRAPRRRRGLATILLIAAGLASVACASQVSSEEPPPPTPAPIEDEIVGECVDAASEAGPPNFFECGAFCCDGRTEICVDAGDASFCEAQDECSDEGWDWCNGSCVDLMNDWTHCGTCGSGCTDGAECSNGSCVER